MRDVFDRLAQAQHAEQRLDDPGCNDDQEDDRQELRRFAEMTGRLDGEKVDDHAGNQV